MSDVGGVERPRRAQRRYSERAAEAALAMRPWLGRKRVWFVLLVLSAALINPQLNPFYWVKGVGRDSASPDGSGGPGGDGGTDDRLLWDPREGSALSPEQINNRTLKLNPFFADQLLFNNATLLGQLVGLFAPVAFEPHAVVLAKGHAADLLIIQNGSCRLEGDAERPTTLNRVFHAGDSLGGLNVMYGEPNMHNVVASSSGMFAWRADSKAVRQFLNRDPILAGAFERKFLRSIIEKESKRPLIFFPGFASSQLIAWKPKKCVGLSIDVGERVWLDVAKVLQHNVVAERCFVNCMALDILEQTDPPDCKLRPEEGVNAIYELSSGLFAPFTTIFRPLVLNMARKFGYDITSFMAVPYDWRIAPSLLEERDHLFTRLKQNIEQTVRLNRNAGTSVCHSMGCNVFEYFIEFLKKEHPDTWQQWIDDHLWMHLSVGAPFLGAVQSVKGFMTGIGFSLPMEVADARLMGKTWSSGYWLLPHNVTSPTPLEGVEKFSQWPNELVTLFVDDGDTNPLQNVTFGIDDVTSGRMFTEIAKWVGDEDFSRFKASMDRFYHHEKRFNPIAIGGNGPVKFPVKKIVAVYGVDVPTEIGYRLNIGDAHSKKPVILKEEVYETAGGKYMTRNPSLLSNMRPLPNSKPLYTKSGDGVVPYASLSHINSWHYKNLNISRFPATSRIDLDSMLTRLGDVTNLKDQMFGIKRNIFESTFGGNIMHRINVVEPAFTKYYSSEPDPTSDDPYEITVLEVQSVGHRDVIRDGFILQQIEEELYNQARAKFLRTHKKARKDPSATAATEDDLVGPLDSLIGYFSALASLSFSSLSTDAQRLVKLLSVDTIGSNFSAPPSPAALFSEAAAEFFRQYGHQHAANE